MFITHDRKQLRITFTKVWRLVLEQQWEWSGPKKVEVVIFDKVTEAEIRSLIGDLSNVVFDPRFERRLYVLTFLKAVLSFMLSPDKLTFTESYFRIFLKETQPSAIISGSYFSKTLYESRPRKRPSLQPVLVVFQTGLWSRLPPPVNHSLAKGDLVFALSSAYADKWSELSGPATVISCGTLGQLQHRRSNMEADSVSHSQNSRSMARTSTVLRATWISVWRNEDTQKKWSKDGATNHYAIERFCLPRLLEILGDLEISLTIFGSKKAEDSVAEKAFYKSFLPPSGWSFEASEPDRGTYLRIDRYDFIIGAGSTLLYECLLLNKRVFFVEESKFEKARPPLGLCGDRENSPFLLKLEAPGEWKEIIARLQAFSSEELLKEVEQAMGVDTVQATWESTRRTLMAALRAPYGSDLRGD